ncbi:MAG: hypothetical protein ACFCVD_13150 [Nodosilinea sp.]
MDSKTFEARHKEQIRDILNRLQSVILVSSQLEATLADIGESVHGLSRDVEQFLAEHSADRGPETD